MMDPFPRVHRPKYILYGLGIVDGTWILYGMILCLSPVLQAFSGIHFDNGKALLILWSLYCILNQMSIE